MPPTQQLNRDAVCFGTIVYRLRTERGWTLAELSRRSGMHATHLGVMERGGNVPSLLTLIRLAEVFGVETAELVREFEQERKKPGLTAARR